MKKLLALVTWSCFILLIGFALGWNSRSVVEATEIPTARVVMPPQPLQVSYQPLQSTLVPLEFTFCWLCGSVLHSETNRDWKVCNREISFNR